MMHCLHLPVIVKWGGLYLRHGNRRFRHSLAYDVVAVRYLPECVYRQMSDQIRSGYVWFVDIELVLRKWIHSLLFLPHKVKSVVGPLQHMVLVNERTTGCHWGVWLVMWVSTYEW